MTTAAQTPKPVTAGISTAQKDTVKSLTSGPPTAPAKPTAVGGDGQVSLDWGDNLAPDLAGYRVHRSETPGGPYTDVSGLLGTSSYLDPNVVNGTPYFYVVTAEDLAGQVSAFSPEGSATPSAAPPPVAYWRRRPYTSHSYMCWIHNPYSHYMGY